METEIGNDSRYKSASLPLLSGLLSEMQMVCFLDGFQLSMVMGAGTGAERVTVA